MTPFTRRATCSSWTIQPWMYHIRWQYPRIRHVSSMTATRELSWFQRLKTEMLGRPATFMCEETDVNAHNKLLATLAPFLPQDNHVFPPPIEAPLPIGHHLIWFNALLPPDQLLPDGTDPLHSPGEPWVRRMWAGGSLHLQPAQYYSSNTGFVLGKPVVCKETIQDVQLRGHGDAAKIFITIERTFAISETLNYKCSTLPRAVAASNEAGQGRLASQHLEQQSASEHWGDGVMKEQRILVFLKDKTFDELEAIKQGHSVPIRYIDAPASPTFYHTLTPTRSLLFRYSALTFNAHLIHLDRQYARSVEGHRNLLVHGPLALTLMLQALSGFVREKSGPRCVLESINYRNLAPLYCDEEMRICGKYKKQSPDGDSYDVWIEGPTGGVAVKGVARTTMLPVTREAQGL